MATPLAELLNPEAEPANDTEAPKLPDIAFLKRMYSESFDLTVEARQEALIDLQYYHGKQWTAAELAALADRKQPDIVINRVRPAVNGMIGVVERGRSDPRAFPRNPDDTDSADTATDVLRYIADFNRFHRIKQDCFTDELIQGSMAAIVGVDPDNQVEITQIRWEEFFADPRSRRLDFKDARYLGIAKWMYADQASALYPEKRNEINAAADSGSFFTDPSNQDRPANAGPISWCDRKTKRLMVIELYYQDEGTWKRCVFHVGGVLEYDVSPYLDQKGRPCCPVEAQSAYVDGDNARYGTVRDMRGPQDEINKRRSKLLHLISVSQIEAVDPSAIDVDASVARKEAARPDGVIPYGWRKVSTSDMAVGQAQLLAEAKGEIERMGPNPAVLGRSGEDQSGRALLARQQAGLVELALIFGGLEDWELRIYRQCWARAKQFWTAAMWIRVTDDEDAPKFVGINQPPGPAVTDPMSGQPMAHPQTGAPAFMATKDAQGQPLDQPQMVFGLRNPIGEMDVDIILDTTPDQGTLAHEQFASLLQLMGLSPQLAQQVPLELLLRLSSLPHVRQIIDGIKAYKEEQAKAQAEQAQRAQQLAEASAIANIKNTEAQAAERAAKAEDTTVRTQTHVAAAHIDAFRAGIDSVPQPDSSPPPGAS